jgi:hypothetical protein
MRVGSGRAARPDLTRANPWTGNDNLGNMPTTGPARA